MNIKKFKKFFIQCIGTVIGSCIMAIAVSLFLLPNELSTGGFSGIATIIYYILKIPMGTTIIILNIPLFIFAGLRIGKQFLLMSIVGTISLSFFIDFFEKFEAVTYDNLLACIYGGILVGIGTAIILKNNSSTGGSDLLTRIFKEYMPSVKSGSIITITVTAEDKAQSYYTIKIIKDKNSTSNYNLFNNTNLLIVIAILIIITTTITLYRKRILKQ